MRARVRKKGMVLTEMKGFSGTFTHQKNASAFDIKRKCVSLQTQGRFSSNASAFWMERTCVFYEQKQKEILHGNGHKKRSSAELQPLLTLNLILWKTQYKSIYFIWKQQNPKLKNNVLQHTLTKTYLPIKSLNKYSLNLKKIKNKTASIIWPLPTLDYFCLKIIHPLSKI